MRRQRLQRAALLLGAVCLATVFAMAHDDRRATPEYTYQAGYGQGYQAGFDHGRLDREHRHGFSYDCDEYRHADRGYSNSLRHKDRYRSGFQAAYRLGYTDGYENQPFRFRFAGGAGFNRERGGDGFRREFGFNSTDSRRWDDRDDRGRFDSGFEIGRRNGYEKGLEKGRKDYQKGRGFDPGRHDAYRDADDGYRSHFGSREWYRQGFRRGFEEGYRQGYGGHGGYSASWRR